MEFELIEYLTTHSKQMAFICGLLFAFLFYFKRKEAFVSFLYLIYAVSFFSTSFLLLSSTRSLNPWSILYLLLILPIFFASFKMNNQSLIVTDSSLKQLKLLADVFVAIGVPAVLFYGYYAYLTLTTLDLSVVRLDYSFILPHNILNTFFAGFATLYFIPLVLYFCFLKYDVFPKYRVVLLFSTLSYPLLTLCYAGRDGVLFWVMNFVVLFFFFRSDIRGNKSTKKLLRVVTLLVSFFILVFITISIARFGSSVKGPAYSFVGYMGQQSIHFSNTFDMDYWLGKGSIFPGFRKMLGLRTPGLDMEDYVALGILDEYNVFSFFVGQWMRSYGKIGCFVIAFLFFLITRFYVNSYSKGGSVIDLLVIFMLFQIPMNGVFYYRQGIGNGDVIYILFWLIVVIYKKIKL